MKRKNFTWLLLGILLSVVSFSEKTFADSSADQVTVVLHKRVWKETLPELKENHGMEMDFGGEALPGATFNIYDLTNRYHEAEKQTNFSAKEYMLNWAKKTQNQLAEENLGQPLVTKVTDTSGEFSVTLPEKQVGKDAVYLFVETDVNVPKGFILDQTSSAPIMIVLPIIDPITNHSLSSIHIYPKNSFQKEQVPSSKPEESKKPLLPYTGQQKSGVAILGFLIILSVVGFLVKSSKRNEEK